MEKKHCTGCGNILPSNHIGRLCPICQEKALEKTPGTSLDYYNIRDMAAMLDLSEGHVRRLSRDGNVLPGRIRGIKQHLWPKEIVDEWIKQGQVFPKIPTSPLQEEAKERCERKDHGWLYEDRFDGIAYSSKEAAKQQSERVTVTGHNRICYFCGYSVFVSSMIGF